MEHRKPGNRSKPHCEPGRTHEGLVEDWQQNAALHEDEIFDFVRSLKRRDYGVAPDQIASQLHEEAFQILDCTQCANCCKVMSVVLDQFDIERIAEFLKMTAAEFIQLYLESCDQQGTFVMRQKPCPLLGEDNRCTVYDLRPTGCREFPHTNKDDFVFRTYTHSANALNCPAVFWIIERMRQKAGR